MTSKFAEKTAPVANTQAKNKQISGRKNQKSFQTSLNRTLQKSLFSSLQKFLEKKKLTTKF